MREKSEYLLSPIIWHYTFLEKSEVVVVFPRNRPAIVTKFMKSYPVYIPGRSRLLALDITSNNLDEKFFDITSDYEGFESENTVLTSKLYNLDQETSRAVSRGQISEHTLNDNLAQAYHYNLLNSLFAAPSILEDSSFWAPTRWFSISSIRQNAPNLTCTVNYNVGLVYIDPNSIDKAIETTVWLNERINVYRVPVKFLVVDHDGYVHRKGQFLYFPSKPKKADTSGLQLCTIFSFNNYSTDFEEYQIPHSDLHILGSHRHFGGHINDLCRLLFPYKYDQVASSDFVLQWNIEKDVIRNTFHGFEATTGYDTGHRLGLRSERFDLPNPLLDIKEIGDSLNVRMANPALISHLIHYHAAGKRGDPSSHLIGENILMGLEKVDDEFDAEPSMSAYKYPEFTQLKTSIRGWSYNIEKSVHAIIQSNIGHRDHS